MDRRRFIITAPALTSLLALASCADDAAGRSGAAEGDSTEGFPLTISNCDEQLLFEQPPQRLVLLESAPVTLLDGIGVLDAVVARAGAFADGYYDDDLASRIEAIPALSEELDSSGHLLINQETVLAQSPDLVFGLPDGVTREGLSAAGAQVVVQESFCTTTQQAVDFTPLYDQIALYGTIFGRQNEADELTSSVQERVRTVSADSASLGPITAAAVYPSVGSGPLYAYGAGSMVTAQLGALGVENAFGDTMDRVFEISDEALLGADPDVLIILYQGDGDGSEAVEELRSKARLSALRALGPESSLPLLFNFCDPPSPLIVDGLERISRWLHERQG